MRCDQSLRTRYEVPGSFPMQPEWEHEFFEIAYLRDRQLLGRREAFDRLSGDGLYHLGARLCEHDLDYDEMGRVVLLPKESVGRCASTNAVVQPYASGSEQRQHAAPSQVVEVPAAARQNTTRLLCDTTELLGFGQR